jgi:hypothetical protein
MVGQRHYGDMLHDGGLLGVMRHVFFRLSINAGSCFDGDILGRTRLLTVLTWLTRPLWPFSFECLTVSMPQSNRVRVEISSFLC